MLLKIFCFVIAFLVSAAPICSSAELRDENLLQGIPPGYKIDFQAKKGNMIMMEMVPHGESVKNWTEMVTTNIYLGLKSATPESYRAEIGQMWGAVCKGSQFAPVTKGKENGYPFSIWIQVCPLNPSTGKPEYTWFKAIKGNDSFYVVQKAFKFQPSEKQNTKWMQYFHSIIVCDSRLKGHPCPKVTKYILPNQISIGQGGTRIRKNARAVHISCQACFRSNYFSLPTRIRMPLAPP